MPSLAAQLALAGHAEKRLAWRDYRSIVRRADHAEAGDADRIIAACELLGISLEDMTADAQAYRSLPGYVRRAEEFGEHREALTIAVRAEAKKKQEVKERSIADEKELRAIRSRIATATHKCSIAESAREQIAHLTARNWRIFAAPAPAPEGQPGLPGLHPEAVTAWLAAEPESVCYSHAGDPTVLAALRKAGYEKGVTGLWVRTDVKEAKDKENHSTIEDAIEEQVLAPTKRKRGRPRKVPVEF